MAETLKTIQFLSHWNTANLEHLWQNAASGTVCFLFNWEKVRYIALFLGKSSCSYTFQSRSNFIILSAIIEFVNALNLPSYRIQPSLDEHRKILRNIWLILHNIGVYICQLKRLTNWDESDSKCFFQPLEIPLTAIAKTQEHMFLLFWKWNL